MFNSSASTRGRIAGVIPAESALSELGEAAAPVGAGLTRGLWHQPALCRVTGLE